MLLAHWQTTIYHSKEKEMENPYKLLEKLNLFLDEAVGAFSEEDIVAMAFVALGTLKTVTYMDDDHVDETISKSDVIAMANSINQVFSQARIVKHVLSGDIAIGIHGGSVKFSKEALDTLAGIYND